jgi:uncharacterized protein (DUF4415 family)
LPKGFPDSPHAWEKLIAEAPGEDRPPTPEELAQWESGFISRSLPEFKAKLAERRARKAEKAATERTTKKMPATIRFDADVLAALRATGKGWQARVNDAMREWLKTHAA